MRGREEADASTIKHQAHKNIMKTNELLEIIGESRGEFIATGVCGNARLYSNGWVMVDPCYVFEHKDGSWTEFLQAKYALKPTEIEINKWLGESFTEWVPVEFRGETVYVISTGGDGDSSMGLCTDSGTNAAVPFNLLPDRIKDLIQVVDIENAD